jgi:hypothetical protein
VRQRVIRSITIAGAAFTGLLGAHALDYSLLARDRWVRDRLLASSGHVWLARAPRFALVALVIAAIGAFALGYADHRRARRSSALRTWMLLSLVQGGAFVAMEAGERLAAHASASRLLQVTVLGLAIQLLTAAVAAVGVHLMLRVGVAVARAVAGPAPVGPRVRAAARLTTTLRSTYPGTQIFGRAPPLSV